MKSLTFEELKALEVGDWVWVVDIESPKHGSGYWKVHGFAKTHIHLNQGTARWVAPKALYGKMWLAYKNKEQAESKGEIVELPCKVGDIIYVPYVYRDVSDIMRLPVKEIRIIKHSIEFCTDFETDDEVFAIKFNNGSFLLGSFCDIWFTDKSQAEARLQELRGEK